MTHPHPDNALFSTISKKNRLSIITILSLTVSSTDPPDPVTWLIFEWLDRFDPRFDPFIYDPLWLPRLDRAVGIDGNPFNDCDTLDKFHFRWLENSIVEIGKSALFPLIFNHLNWNPSKKRKSVIFWLERDWNPKNMEHRLEHYGIVFGTCSLNEAEITLLELKIKLVLSHVHIVYCCLNFIFGLHSRIFMYKSTIDIVQGLTFQVNAQYYFYIDNIILFIHLCFYASLNSINSISF